jgi:glycosyltransferase involved in cell wall biosynthesis
VTNRLSFIVPVRNDAVRLEQCLHSIRQNAAAPDDLDIIVVDNGSTDGSSDVARRLGAHVITVGDARVSDLRNRGARHASGNCLAFVDADNEIVPGWAAAAVDTLQMHAVAAAGAAYHAPRDGTWVQRAYGYLRGKPRGRHDVDWLGSGNLAVRRDTFESLGGFDTALDTCEDVDLCNRIRARGLRVVSDARLESVHHGDPRTLRDLFTSERWRGRDNLRVSFRGPISWAALPSALVPIVDAALLGVAGAALLATPGVGRSGLVVAAAALLAIAVGSCLKVLRAAVREGSTYRVGLLRAFVVACVYDTARALALVTRARHRHAHPAAAAATP